MTLAADGLVSAAFYRVRWAMIPTPIAISDRSAIEIIDFPGV